MLGQLTLCALQIGTVKLRTLSDYSTQLGKLQYRGAFSDMNEKHIKDCYGPRIDLILQASHQQTQETTVSM